MVHAEGSRLFSAVATGMLSLSAFAVLAYLFLQNQYAPCSSVLSRAQCQH